MRELKVARRTAFEKGAADKFYNLLISEFFQALENLGGLCGSARRNTSNHWKPSALLSVIFLFFMHVFRKGRF